MTLSNKSMTFVVFAVFLDDIYILQLHNSKTKQRYIPSLKLTVNRTLKMAGWNTMFFSFWGDGLYRECYDVILSIFFNVVEADGDFFPRCA